MHLVDDVDPFFYLCRRIYHIIPNGSDIIYAIIRRCIDLLYIKDISSINAPARGTAVAGIPIHWIFTVYGLGQYLGTGGFTRTPGAGKKVGMAELSGNQLIFQGGGHSSLPHNIVKGLRPVFPVKGLIHVTPSCR